MYVFYEMNTQGSKSTLNRIERTMNKTQIGWTSMFQGFQNISFEILTVRAWKGRAGLYS